MAPDCKIVTARNRLTFKNGNYTYELSRQGNNVVYTVSDGANSISKPILYCFGQGHIGQTYLFRHNDILYETRVSYFQKIGGSISRSGIDKQCRRRLKMRWDARSRARRHGSVSAVTRPAQLTAGS